MSGRPELKQVATLFSSSSSSSSSSAPPPGSGRFLATPGPVKSGDTNLNKKKLYSFLYSIGAQKLDFQKLNAFQDVLRELGDTQSSDKTFSRDQTTALDEFISSVLSRPEGIPASLREIIRAYQDAKNKNKISNFTVVGLDPPASENFYSDSLKALLDDFELLFINNIIKPGRTKKATVQKNYKKLTYDEKLKEVAFGVKGNSLGAGAKQVENRLIGLLWEVDLEDRINHRNNILPSIRKLGIRQEDYFSLQIRPMEPLPAVVERGKKKEKKEAKEQRPELSESEKRREEVLSTVFVPVSGGPALQPAPAPFYDPYEEMTPEEREEDRRRMDQLVMEAREIEAARLAGRGRRSTTQKFFSGQPKMANITADPALKFLVSRSKNPFVPGTRPEAMRLKPCFSLVTAEYKDCLNRGQKAFCIFLWKDYCKVVFSGERGTMPDLFINTRPCGVDQFKEALLKNRRILTEKIENPLDLHGLKSAEKFAKIVERKVPSFELALQGLEQAMKQAAREGDTARMADLAKQKKRLIDNRKFFEDENEKLQKESDLIPVDEKFTSSSGKVYAYQGLLNQDDFARVLQGNQCDSVLVRDAVNSLINIRATELVNKVIYYSRNDLGEHDINDEDKQIFDAIRGISKPRRYCSPTEIGPDYIIRKEVVPAVDPPSIAISTQAPPAYISSNPNAVMNRRGVQTVVPLDFVDSDTGKYNVGEQRYMPFAQPGATQTDIDAVKKIAKDLRDGVISSDNDAINAAMSEHKKFNDAQNEALAAAYGSSSSSGL